MGKAGTLMKRLGRVRERLGRRVKFKLDTSSSIFHCSRYIPVRLFSSYIRSRGTTYDSDSFEYLHDYQLQRRGAPTGSKYIVSSDYSFIYASLGALLYMLGPCWKYALDTGRTLVIDWRASPFTRNDHKQNLFSHLFEQPDEGAIGVPVICDDSVNELRLPQPILGPVGALRHESGKTLALRSGGIGTLLMRKVIVSGYDVEQPTILPPVPTTIYVGEIAGPLSENPNPHFDFEEGKRFYQNLVPRSEWKSLASEFYESDLSERPVVGVHIRHGNGEAETRDHFRHRQIGVFEEFITDLELKIKRYASRRFGEDYTLFLCTDSKVVLEAMRERFPNFATRPRWLPEPGEGMDFDHVFKEAGAGVRTAGEALVDMMLLGMCDAALISRSSKFSCLVPFLQDKPGAEFLDHDRVAAL